MNEVDRLTVDLGGELIESVDPGLLSPPVVTFLPIVRELADFVDVGAVFPGRARQLIGPFRRCQTTLKIGEHNVRNMSFEGLDGCRIFRSSLTVTRPKCNEYN